uniref:Transporter n=1 Tax=Strigamia maritima TaxID=126957 RepID=T1IHZ1_STRMM
MVWHIPGIRMPLSVVVPNSAAASNKAPERGHWGSKAEFILSCVGMSVGMGNVWRFPYQVFKNGGGVGIAASIVSMFVALYYNMFMVYALIYFVFCFSPTLPWSECGLWGGPDDKCYIRGTNPCESDKRVQDLIHKVLRAAHHFRNTTPSIQNLNDTAKPCTGYESAGTKFWKRYILNLEPHTSISNVGNIQWRVLVALIVSWILIFLCIGRGIKTSGKVVYVTAIFPYCVLIVLFIMGINLDGAGTGLDYLFVPDWSKLATAHVWSAAASQMFFSLNVAYGGVIMFSSYNHFQNKVKTDAMIVTTMDTFTSLIASVVIFSIVGNMAHTMNLKWAENNHDLIQSGPGLAFEVVPEAILNLGIPHLWCALFMLMLVALAIDSEFAYVETFLTAIYDELPVFRRHKVLTCGAVCTVCCLIGISFTTQGGMYVLEFIDMFCAGNSALIVGIFEMISIFWIYGLRNFLDDTQFMLGKRPGYYWRICWTIVDPILLMMWMAVGIVGGACSNARNKLLPIGPDCHMIMFCFAMYGWSSMQQFRGESYPDWAIGVGVLFTILTIISIPIYFVYYIVKNRKGVNLKDAFRPAEDWGPSDPYMRSIYKEWKAKEPRPGTQVRSLPNFAGLMPAPDMLQPTESRAAMDEALKHVENNVNRGRRTTASMTLAW